MINSKSQKTSQKTTPQKPATSTESATTVMLDEAQIEKWALDNKPRAKALGMRMFQHQGNPNAMKALKSLGDMEDKVTEWAIQHPAEAKGLFMRLAMKIMA